MGGETLIAFKFFFTVIRVHPNFDEHFHRCFERTRDRRFDGEQRTQLNRMIERYVINGSRYHGGFGQFRGRDGGTHVHPIHQAAAVQSL